MARPAEQATGAESAPGPELAASLGIIALFFLPLLAGGYSGTGYQVSFVLLPIAAAIAWGVCRQRNPLAAVVILLFLLFGVAMPFWVNPGRLLWYYLLSVPCAWILTTMMLSQAPHRAKWLLPATTLGAVLTGFYGWYLWLGAGTIHYQMVSTFGLHNPYAGYLLLAWPLTAFAAVLERRAVLKWAYYAAAAFLALTLVLTYSKASWVMFMLQLALLAIFGALQLRRGRQAIRYPGWLAGGVVVAGAALLSLPTVRSALVSLTDLSGYSMQGRLKFWRAALEMFTDHPLLGVGPGNFAYYYPRYQADFIHYSVDPHSWPLQLLAELGLPGLIILVCVVAGTVIWARKLSRTTGGSMAAGLLIAAVLGSMAHAALDFDYTFTATTALLGVVFAWGSFLVRREPDSTKPVRQPVWLKGVAAASVVVLLIYALVGEFLTTERYNLDRLRELSQVRSPTTQQVALRANLLRQCIASNKYNYRTRYQLASLLLQPGQGDDAGTEGQEHLDRALELNENYPRAWALKGLTARTPEEREEFLARAIELDPFNYPEHHWQYAALAREPQVRKQRLLAGMECIQATEPVTLEHVRPTWYELNPLFARWWEELALLEDDEELKQLYRQRAARIKVYWDGQNERLAGPADSS